MTVFSRNSKTMYSLEKSRALHKTLYCTYFNYNFAPLGLSLLESLSVHDSKSFIYILCLDNKIFSLLKSLQLENVELLKLIDLENTFPELLTAKSNRSITEYYWTLTPYLLFYFLFLKKKCSRLTYLDADQFFYSDPKVVFDEIGDSDVAIMPHRFPDSTNSSREHGEFNVSWLTFSDTPNAQNCLEWWKAACHEWCYAAGDKNRYGDQKYLDEFPIRFDNVHIIQNIGAGVAPWNLMSFNFQKQLILFHFQSFRILSSNVLSATIPKIEESNLKDFKALILIPYFNSIKKNLLKVESISTTLSDKSAKLSSDLIYFIHFLGKVFIIRSKVLRLIISLLILDRKRPSSLNH